MDSQRTVDHLRDAANARKDTTLGDLLDTAAEELDEAESEIERLKASLNTIAGGMTDEFPGAPDLMSMTPESFRGAMWSWSQKVARHATES